MTDEQEQELRRAVAMVEQCGTIRTSFGMDRDTLVHNLARLLVEHRAQAFVAGAASRDAEVAELQAINEDARRLNDMHDKAARERDALREQLAKSLRRVEELELENKKLDAELEDTLNRLDDAESLALEMGERMS